MQQGVDELDLLLACMAGYVGIFGDDFNTTHSQLVDDLRYLLFVARDRGRAHDHDIVWLNGYLAVQTGCHTGQSRHGLALASCGDQNGLLVRIIL